jgi:GDP-4-dehydro-6-deoxy-D-mannose reductase
VKHNALLIGGTGFVGNHLQALLLQRYNVTVTDHTFDIRDANKMNMLVEHTTPDVVVNLASITTVKESFNRPFDTYQIGFWGTLNLLMALKRHGFKGRLLNISSSEVYGFPSDDQLPIVESTSLRPRSPYSVSKAAVEAMCYQWSQTEDFKIVTVRPFTHIGPGQSDRFAIAHFAKQIAEILVKKKSPVIRVGDLKTTRDFTDVRDVVRAYDTILDNGRNGEVYNVCSGKEIVLESLLNDLIKHSGILIKVEQDESLLRHAEQRRIYGSYDKLTKESGWHPVIPLTQTLKDMLSSWTSKLANFS